VLGGNARQIRPGRVAQGGWLGGKTRLVDQHALGHGVAQLQYNVSRR